MRTLDRKLLRDLGRLWAQSLAVALVMACGVATLILSVGTYRSLESTRAAYYDRYRFGDIWATVTRAPLSLARSIGDIDGVAAIDARINEHAILDIPGLREPATGSLVSIPANGEMAVNALFMREGRLPEAARTREVVVSANFAKAHGFTVGSDFAATVNGSRLALTIVGVALSPEYVYAIGPGDMMPDDRRFGIIWMPEKVLASLFDLDGAFNSVSLRLLRDASPTAVIEVLDRMLKPYGGTGAIARKDQLSNAFLDGELTQLNGMSKIIPPIFLVVAAFLINMILSRLISLEREQIGLLKALGFSRLAVAWHYLKLVLVITGGGLLIGGLLGTWAGHGLTVVYTRFYAFPFLIFSSSPDVYLIAGVVTVASAIGGAFQAIGKAFALPAAVAMRAPAPQVYRQLLGGFWSRLFSQPTTMALRHVLRSPVRSLLTAVGVAFSVALIEMAIGTVDSIETMIDSVFFQADREDATLMFGQSLPASAITDVRRLPGVLLAEGYMTVPAKISSGQYSRQLVITGKATGADLSRVLDFNQQPVALPETGLALGDRVAELLHVSVGDIVTVEMLDGLRRTVDVPVTQVLQNYIGLPVTMETGALARLSGTGPRLSGAYVSLDDSQLDDLYRAVQGAPKLGAIALLSMSRQRFQETMRQNLVVQIGVYLVLSITIAFGVVYNSARIQLSERANELATLRVLGFHRAEVARILFIEVGAIVAVALPIGWAIGTAFGFYITRSLATDLFRVPFSLTPRNYAVASLVAAAATLISLMLVRRRIYRLDLVRVLKTRE
jgi:putative ABC transport system permease protein